jgi:putative membrane-bound dehydrogenase-like protein
MVVAAAVMVSYSAAEVALCDEFPKAFDTQELTERLLSPQEALDAISVPDGFNVTLYAAEPDVRQPISLATDARGRLWVVENYTYAEREVNFETEKQRDRILIFEDTDGNGQFDKRTVFWDEGLKATSVEIGFGGVWVLAAPNLLFIPDRNRDDVPDSEPEVVLNGWDDGRIRHNIVNGLRWGPDGWLYGRHGIQATSVVGTPETAPEHRTQLECAIWRYHPTRRLFEVVARGTTNPWGMDWDEHGQLFFINTVIGHLWHVVPGSYYQRMYGDHFDPHVYELLPQNADHYHWDISEEKWHDTKKIGVTATTDKAGGGHAHQGMMIYAGDNWPDKYRGQLFTFNFHGRRMNADRLERHGATYVGRHEDDLLKTSDPWFRGIEMVYGPDGGVIVADWSDIGECHENDGIHRTSGRLFKVTHGRVRHQKRDLNELSSTELVKLLRHRNEWFARKARRVLQERAFADADLGEARHDLFAMYDTSSQVTDQLRAMWSLNSIGAINEHWLINQLDDDSEHIRVWAIQLLIDQGAPSALAREALESRAMEDSSGLVLSFLTSALRQIPHEHRWKLARRLAQRDAFAEDSHYPLLVWYGIEPAVAAFPAEAVALASDSRLPVVSRHIARRLTEEIERQPKGVAALVQLVLEQDRGSVSQDVLQGMHEAVRGWSKTVAPPGWKAVEKKFARGDVRTKQLVRDLSLVFGSGRALDELRELATSNETPLDVRRQSIQSLVGARAKDFAPTLQSLLDVRYINVEAIRGLAAYDDPDTPRLLLEAYDSFHQPARQEAISTFVSRPEYCRALLSAVEDGAIDREQVSSFQIRQMQMFESDAIDAKIKELWPELQAIPQQKQQQIASYRTSLTPNALGKANLSNGRGIFKQQCARCHQLFDDGELVGPALTGAQRNNLNYLLENIVDPSATVSKNYQLTIVLLEDGRVLNGILMDQNDRTITLRTANERLILARDEIEEIRDSQLSMMPDRQLDVMKSDQVRDLIAYLMSPSQVQLP